jgi:hypothetical protein
MAQVSYIPTAARSGWNVFLSGLQNRTESKYEARNPKFETISNDQNLQQRSKACFEYLVI